MTARNASLPELKSFVLPGEEEPRGALAPARKDEALQLWQRRVRLLDVVLQTPDRVGRNAQPALVAGVRHRQVRPEIEQLVLDALEAARPAHERIQLVDVAHRRHARVELRDARAVAEARLTLVPAARVDARQADGLVALPHAP